MMMTFAPKVPRGIVESNVTAAFALYDAWVRGTTDYWAGAFARRATPLDVLGDVTKWAGTALRRDRPQWATEHRVVAEWPCARLRDFTPEGTPEDTVAALILPPQAGHDSSIADYSAAQSQVRTALDSGVARVAALDWKGATFATKDMSIDDYLVAIHESATLLGGRVNLVGDCQGGWLAVIYAALYPETVNTLTIAGAPIDFHAGEPLLHDWVRLLTPGDSMAVYKGAVAANGGVLPGDFLLQGFIGLQPQNELDRQLQLLAHINDDAYVERYKQFETWFQWTQPLPGAFYLWIVEHLFKDNELIRGVLEVRGDFVELSRIDMPVFLLAGATDYITPPAQVWALQRYVSTPADQITCRLADGGHLGLFMGHAALANQWAPTFTEMAAIRTKL